MTGNQKQTICLDAKTKAQMALALLETGTEQQKAEALAYLKTFVNGAVTQQLDVPRKPDLRAIDVWMWGLTLAEAAKLIRGEYFKDQPLTEDEALRLATHRHYKGGIYRELFRAKHSESGEDLTIYLHLWPHENSAWARPVEMFHGNLEDGQVRFTPLTQGA